MTPSTPSHLSGRPHGLRRVGHIGRQLVTAFVAVAGFGALGFALPTAAQDNSCRYAFDSECDEPRFCANGTDSFDCRGLGTIEPNVCFFAYDGECDEPGIGTGVCPAASDSWDCRSEGKPPGPDSCPWAFDNECDEPGIGTGLCVAGTDTEDCRGSGTGQIGDAANSCRWAFDLECDEPGIGLGVCAAGTDTADCAALYAGGNDTCQWAFDGECDEPGIGLGVCTDGTDTTDCAPFAHLRHRDNSCHFAFDDQCDEPGMGGTGKCDDLTDTVDCLGRDTIHGVTDHFFGTDDRVRLPPVSFPWRAIGMVNFRDGGSCTAALVAPSVVLTAAHCFYDGNVVNPPVEFLAGLNGGSVFASAGVLSYEIARGYDPVLHNQSDQVNGLDYGFITIDQPLGDLTGTFDIHVMSEEDFRQSLLGRWQMISQAGYSWDSPDRLTGHLDCEIVRYNEDNTILHECDTTFGDSGSPIFAEMADGSHAIVAIDSQFMDDGRSRQSAYLAVDSRAFGPAFQRLITGGKF